MISFSTQIKGLQLLLINMGMHPTQSRPEKEIQNMSRVRSGNENLNKPHLKKHGMENPSSVS